MKRAALALVCVLAAASSGCMNIMWPGHGQDHVDSTFAKFCSSPNPLRWFGEDQPVNGAYHWGHGAIGDDGHGCGHPCNCVCPGGPGGPGGPGDLAIGPDGQPMVAPGASAGAVGYPYYTTRGPRDFLLNNPPSIGP